MRGPPRIRIPLRIRAPNWRLSRRNGGNDCIYEGEDQLYIHPDECIDCGACEPECPVTAIFPEEDVPPNMTAFIEKNKEVFNGETPPGRPQR